MIAHRIFKKVLGDENPHTNYSYEQYTDIRRKLGSNLNLSFVNSRLYKKKSSILSFESSEDFINLKLAL